MAETFQFKLVTPTGVLFDGAVEQVTAVGALGEFGVLPLHTNFITSLVPGILTLKIGEASYIEFLLAGSQSLIPAIFPETHSRAALLPRPLVLWDCRPAPEPISNCQPQLRIDNFTLFRE